MTDLQIQTFALDLDGTTRLEVLLPGPLPDDVDVIFEHVGGTATVAPDGGALLSWTWGPQMVPLNPRQVVREHIDQILEAWSLRWITTSGNWSSASIALAPFGEDL